MNELVERHMSVIAPVIGFDNDVEMVTGEGAWLTGADGKQYLDFACGISVVNCGHRHPRVVAAVEAQMQKVWHAGGTFRYEAVVAAAEKMVEVAPAPIDMFFFMNSGAEAVEASVKLARHTSGRQGVVVFRGGFHGRTMGSVSYTTSSAKYRRGYLPLLPSVFVSAFPHPFRWGLSPEVAAERSLAELRRLFRHEVSPDEIACFLVEPVQGEGGYYPAPPEFLDGLREICDDYGILLIVDEIQTGFGRTGEYWAVDHYGIQPDIFVLGKGIANGLPLSAVGSTRDRFGKWPMGSHGSTFGGNPLACAAAAQVADIASEQLPHVRELSARAFSRLGELSQKHETIGDVRGLGLMIGIELVEAGTRRPDAAALDFVRNHVLQNGLIFHPCGPDHNIIRFIPPLVISLDDLDKGIDIIDAALTAWETR